MNEAHWHLMLNHFPIVGTIFSFLVLLSGILIKSKVVRQTGLWLFVITGIFTVPAFLTGEGAEETLESVGIKADAFIEQHEDYANIAFWLCEVSALLSLFTLYLEKRGASGAILSSYLIFVISLGNGILMTKVGTSGGEIRHTEIRSENQPVNEATSGNHEVNDSGEND